MAYISMMTPLMTRIGVDRLIPLAILAASLGALGFAYTAEIGFGLEPCPLCLYQRVPFAAAGILALLALAGPLSERLKTGVVCLCGLIFLIGSGIALYHVGVERHWWASAVCSAGAGNELTMADLQKALQAGEPKACDIVDWKLFGISIAGYNVVYSLALAAACFAGVRLLRKPS